MKTNIYWCRNYALQGPFGCGKPCKRAWKVEKSGHNNCFFAVYRFQTNFLKILTGETVRNVTFKIIVTSKLKHDEQNCSICSIFSATLLTVTSCKTGGNKGGSLPKDDGQLHGVAPASRWEFAKASCMVYINPGTFHMGPLMKMWATLFSARNKQVSISGFWMDATEITNNEYRQFTNWVKDSIAGHLMGYENRPGWHHLPRLEKKSKQSNGVTRLRSKRSMPWSLLPITLSLVKRIDANKLEYQSETFDYKAAAMNRDPIPRSKFIIKKRSRSIPILYAGFVILHMPIMNQWQNNTMQLSCFW